MQRKFQHMIGKSIRCPKCHGEFVVALDQPTPVEEAAIKNEEARNTAADQPASPKRKRKTQAQIRRHHLTAIKKAIRPLHLRLTQLASQDKCSEEQIRVWCIDVLRTVLGYPDADIDTELSALQQRIDIAIKHDGKVIMIIECKNVKSKLGQNVVNQAVSYAANKSADWAVVTNGQIWRLYRIIPVKGADPLVIQVFDVSLLDADGVSDRDVANLYMLTNRAITKGETEREYHQVSCLSNQSVISAIMTPRVTKAIRRTLIESYAKANNVRLKVHDDDVETRLREFLLPQDLSDEPTSTASADS